MARKRGNNEGTIYRRNDGRWEASITLGRDPATGKPKRARFYGKTRQEAAEILARALSDLKRGTFVAPHKLTTGAWLDTWLQEYKRPAVRPLTFDSYESLVRCHLKPAIGHITLQDLRPEHLQRLYNERLKAGLSPRSVRYIHAVIHGAIEQAIKHQLVVRNVSEATLLPGDVKRDMQPLTLDQVRQLLAAIEQDRLFSAILLELGTGLRRGELLALRWQDIDLQAGVLRVRQTLERVRIHEATGPDKKTRLLFQEPKTSHSRRTIPIPHDSLEALTHHKARQAEEKLLLGQAYQDHGLVFCLPDGTPLEPRNFTRHFDWLLRKAGLPHIRFHDARHTFATLLLDLGEHPKTVQTMLGHSRIATTLDIYSHVSLELEKRAADKLNTALRG
jgi:integrase